MSYQDLISSNISTETFELIDNSIKIFASLKENKAYIKYNLTDKDFIDLSFLLAILTNNYFTDIKSLLENNDVTALKLGNYFNINIKDIVNSDIDVVLEFDQVFDKYFKDYFNNLLNYLEVTIDEINTKDIISDVTWNLYISGFINNTISKEKQENLYNSLDNGMHTKLINESKYEKIFNVNDFVVKKEYKTNSDKDDYDRDNLYDEFKKTNKKYSVLKNYGYFLDEKEYLKNPAIGREEEIKK